MVSDIGELRKIAQAYSKNQTFVFIEEIINNKTIYYNGYILKVFDDMVLFQDCKIKKEFPILLETIKFIKPSVKEEKRDG